MIPRTWPHSTRRFAAACAALLVSVAAAATTTVGCASNARTSIPNVGDAGAEDASVSADAAPGPPDAASDELSPLAEFPNCGGGLFGSGATVQDFSSAASIQASWKSNWVSPVPAANGALQFGPHPMSADWWENYSPLTSLAKPGDVLLCARLRFTPELGGEVDANTFELTMRLPDNAAFETAGMTLLLLGNASSLRLRTRTGESTWVTHDQKPFGFATGAVTTLDVLLYGRGERFVAHVRDVTSGVEARLLATYPLPSGGAVSMLGWRERAPAFVDQLVIGPPSQAIEERLFR